MFRFFNSKKWFLWAWVGSAAILASLWVQVEIDVKINEWFGTFYDMIQKALAEPNSITIEEYWDGLLSFIVLAGIYVLIAVVVSFFTAHFLFRWRTAMVEWYHSVYNYARKIEGAAQRVQEDTIKFGRIMEGLGTSLIESVMVIVQFLPILLGLSAGIPIFFFGDWQYGLVVGALIWSVGGTAFLIVLGIILRLVGVEYDLQKQEAAYRKMLVIAEDDETVRPKSIEELFDDVRKIHFLSYVLTSLPSEHAADDLKDEKQWRLHLIHLIVSGRMVGRRHHVFTTAQLIRHGAGGSKQPAADGWRPTSDSRRPMAEVRLTSGRLWDNHRPTLA